MSLVLFVLGGVLRANSHGSGSIIILLDEPALGLHARAQRDYLRFIDERLSGKSQVLYTTHSPFMVQAWLLERVRLVEDKGSWLRMRSVGNPARLAW